MPEIKTIITEMKNAFDGHIRTLDKAEERVRELEDKSVKPCQLKNRKKIKIKTRAEYPKTETITKGVTYA